MMPIDNFIATAWSDHGDQPQSVADRLAASLHLIEAAAHIPPYANLVTHVYGEHLGQWDSGAVLLASIRSLTANDQSAAISRVIARNIAALHYGGGDDASLQALDMDDRLCAMATVASAFAGRGDFARAIATYTQALEGASPGLSPDSPALRALAVGGNNLAAALEEKPRRTDNETRAMIAAAHAALTYWKLAGTWLEQERAEYRLARSYLQAQNAVSGALAARRCVAACAANDAPAFERFFAFVVLAAAERDAGNVEAFEAAKAQALGWHDQIPQADRHWCERAILEMTAARR